MTIDQACADRGAEETIEAIVNWLRALPVEWVEDWGLNVTAEIADMLESGRWRSTE